MIVRNVVTEENQIKKILTILCQQYPIKCLKQNISGLGNNERVIVVKGGYFEYYNCPNKFKNGDLSALKQEYFKGKVKLTDIYEVAFLPQNSIYKKMMKLSMPLQHITATNIQLYKDKAATKTLNTPEKGQSTEQKKIVIWLFIFKSNIKQQIFNKLEQEERAKKEKQSKIIKYVLEEDFIDSILNVPKQTHNKTTLPVDPEEELDNNIMKLKEMKEYLEFEENVKRQQEERLRAIRLSLSLRKMEKGEQEQQSQEEHEKEEQIYPIKEAWKDFWKAYEKASKYIGQPVTKEYLQKQLNVLNEIHKIQQEFKVIFQQYINFKLVGWGPERQTFDDFEFYKGIWIKMGGKELNQEFLSNYYLSDLMYIVKPQKKMKFRIAPMFLLKYKGFKAICMMNLPFNSIKALNKEIYNVKAKISSMDAQLVGKIKQNLEIYERIMNVKNQNYINGNYQTNAPLGHDIKVFEYDNKFQDTSTNYLQNFYYVTGVKGLFPIDYNFQFYKQKSEDNKSFKKQQERIIYTYQPQYCLRPEIIAQYRDFMESIYRQNNQLLTQAFKHSQISLQVKGKQDTKVVEVCENFIPLKITQLMNQFNQINLIMVDSYSIKQYMSQMGINSRYLGEMYKRTQIPYIEETLQIEMLSRIIKNIYCQSIKDLVSNEEFFKREMYMKKHKQLLIENMRIHHQMMVNNAIDFLNLVFGIGAETAAFWKIVIEKCKKKYGIQFSYPLKVKSGCLLHAVLWHCKFIVNFQLDIKLFQVEKPFDVKKNWSDFRIDSKVFEFPSFEINKIIKKLAAVDEKNDEQAKNLLSLLKLELLHHNMTFGTDFRTQITLSKINNIGRQLQRPIREASYHPSQLPYYFSNKSHENFKKALDIINFSLASNHPLFISLYDTYSQMFEPQLLKKATLLAAIKGLGQFHPRTTQLYSNFYRQGLEEFEIKAKRSEQTEAALTIIQQFYQKGKYETCVNFCFSRIEMRIKGKSSAKGNQLKLYLNILKYGLISATYTRIFKKGLQIAEEYSEMINAFKIRNQQDHQLVLEHALIIRLSLTNQKFYIYKMVLLVIKIQQQFQQDSPTDNFGLKLPHKEEEKTRILTGIMNQYYLQQTHSKWIQYILNTLKKGYKYFNHLTDLFNNYKYHITNYDNREFQRALGYLDVLIRYFGQRVFFECLYESKV